MTSVLDCSSLDTVLDSASGLLGMSVPQFREALACLEIDWDHHTLAPEDQVARRFGHEDRAQSAGTFRDPMVPRDTSAQRHNVRGRDLADTAGGAEIAVTTGSPPVASLEPPSSSRTSRGRQG